MATNILMPALSPTMTEGTLARWLKHEGDRVSAGDVIAEIETDKATMEVEAVDEGVLRKILVPDGTAGVKVNDPIAVLGEAGEAVEATTPAAVPRAPVAQAGEVAAATPTATPAARAGSDAPVPASGANGVAANGAAPAADGRVFASPLARRMAAQAGIALHGLKGTGPGGRIVRADVEAAMGRAAPAAPTVSGPAPVTPPVPAAAPAPAPAAPVASPHRLVPHSSMRKVIARRLGEAKRDVPHFYVAMDIRLDALLALRTELNARSTDAAPFKLSVNDMIVKAAAIALRRVPEVNAAWTDAGMAMFEDVDISVAVAIPDGLITPIIRRADQKGLAAISAEMRDLGARAKAGKLKPEEFQGGGFSISNMGMYGVAAFSAIINPPQAAILAVAAGEPRAVVRGGAVVVATMMTCTLSVDHRAVDGALASRWLAAFRDVVEEPLTLML